MSFPLYIATGNAGKLKEIAELAQEYFSPLFSTIEGRAAKNADETAHTFIGNGQIKALALENELWAENMSCFAVLADDSGLCVDLLHGKPGVHSARFAGDHLPSEAHVAKLLLELSKIPAAKDQKARKAHYACALNLILNDGTRRFQWNVEGQCHGLIGFKAEGSGGFGYDPVFYVPQFEKTFGEIPFDVKNSISHRRKAFEELKKLISPLYG